MTSLYLGKHHLIDVEGLVDDPDLLAGLLLIYFLQCDIQLWKFHSFSTD